jgi:hypothetical protein
MLDVDPELLGFELDLDWVAGTLETTADCPISGTDRTLNRISRGFNCSRPVRSA